MPDQEVFIDNSIVQDVLNTPRNFCGAVLALAGVGTEAELRTPEELAKMRLCRDALASQLELHRKHRDDMLHNATAGVKPNRPPYFV